MHQTGNIEHQRELLTRFWWDSPAFSSRMPYISSFMRFFLGIYSNDLLPLPLSVSLFHFIFSAQRFWFFHVLVSGRISEKWDTYISVVTYEFLRQTPPHVPIYISMFVATEFRSRLWYKLFVFRYKKKDFILVLSRSCRALSEIFTMCNLLWLLRAWVCLTRVIPFPPYFLGCSALYVLVLFFVYTFLEQLYANSLWTMIQSRTCSFFTQLNESLLLSPLFSLPILKAYAELYRLGRWPCHFFFDRE